MKVLELLDGLDTNPTRNINANLGDITISDDGSTLSVYEDQFMLDELAENALGKYLGISRSYLAKCPGDLRATNFRYWLDHRQNALTMLETLGDKIIGVYHPDAMLIPVRSIYGIISRVFSPDDEIVDRRTDDSRLHIDITTTAHNITVPNPNRMPNRPEVGDITSGGVRILAHPNQAKAPSVQTYLHRLICRNGQTSPEREGMIRLKGHTVPEVLIEMEAAAQQVLAGLDEKLQSYAEMANRPIPGNATSFISQMSREHGLPQKVEHRLIDRANLLPEGASLYDIQQIITETANSGVSYGTMSKLQHVGGSLAFDTEHILHRCGNCQRLLPG